MSSYKEYFLSVIFESLIEIREFRVEFLILSRRVWNMGVQEVADAAVRLLSEF